VANKESKTTFKADISQLNKAFKEAAQQIKIANSEFKAASAGMEDWSKNADGVSAKLKQLNSNLDNEKKKLESLEGQLKRTAQEYGENSNEVQQLTVRVNNQKAKVAETEKEIRKYEGSLKDITGDSKAAESATEGLSKQIGNVGEESAGSTGKLDKFMDGLKTGVTGAAKIAGEAVLGASAAMAAMAAASTNVAVDMDKAMNDFAASTGTAEAELGKYQGVLENIYKNNYGEDFQDIADSMATVTQTLGEMSDEKLQQVTESAFALRDTFEYDISESTRAAKAMFDNFGISADEAFSMIATGAQNGLDYSGEMIDSISEYSSQFAKLGFTADDMFNIFQQGADSGAWNLDKVGDAVKEFSIRAIDGSDSTKEGFEAIGLSADEMSAKFGEGGDTAKKAFSETVKALSSIEDPLKKDAAGVALFGTMWEDLGADVIAQLGNIQSGTYDTKNALEDIKKVKYNDLGSMLEGMKRNIELMALPIGEQLIPAFEDLITDVMPIVEDVFSQFNDGTISDIVNGALPVVKDLLTEIAPVLHDVGEAIKDMLPMAGDMVESILPPAQQIIGVIMSTIKTLNRSVLPPLTKLVDAFANVLEKVLKFLTPVLEGLIEVAAVITGTLIDAVAEIVNAITGTGGYTEALQKTYEEARTLSDEQKALKDRTMELADEMRELDRVADEEASAIQNEYGHYKNLYDMLGDVVDEEGNVLEGKEKQVEYITSVFADALGIEAELMGGRIADYQNYRDAIYDAIAAKQAEATLSAYEEEYNTALASHEGTRQAMVTQQEDITEQQGIVGNKQAALKALDYMSHDELVRTYNDVFQGVKGEEYSDFKRIRDMLTAEADGAAGKLDELNESFKETTDLFNREEIVIKNYGETLSAVRTGDISEMNVATLKLQHDFKDTTTATMEELGLQKAYWRETLQDMEKAVKDGRITEETYEIYKEIARQADEQYDIAVNSAGGMVNRTKTAIENGKPGMYTASVGLGQSVVDGMNSVDYEGSAASAAQRYGATFYNTIAYYAELTRQTIASITNGSRVVEEGVTINSPSDLRAYATPTATGGIVTRAQVRLVGEDGAEAIVPLEKNTHWIDLVAEKVAIAMNGSVVNNSSSNSNRVTNNFYQTNNSPKTLSGPELYRQTKRLLNYNKGR
jgi:phage-related minor tail protein